MTTLTMPAITHLAVTVKNLDVSIPWYTAVFGTEPVFDEDTGPFRHVVYMCGNTMFGLHQFVELQSDEPFEEHRPGLDHIAFGCSDRAELERWLVHLDELGVTNGGIVDAHYGSGLSFRDPDNIALELFCPPTPLPSAAAGAHDERA